MWSLSDTDIVQAQIILAKAGSMGVEKLSLICADNDYGDTFNKWVPHYAREKKLNILDKVQYSDTEELAEGFGRISGSEAEVVICALNDADDAKTVLELAKSNPHAPKIYFTGSVLYSSILELGPLAYGAVIRFLSPFSDIICSLSLFGKEYINEQGSGSVFRSSIVEK